VVVGAIPWAFFPPNQTNSPLSPKFFQKMFLVLSFEKWFVKTKK
jgi:hypothetical protein